MKKQLLLAISGVVFILAPMAVAAAADLRIATGSRNGTYFQIGKDIQQLASENGLEIEILESQGSLHNYEMLDSNMAELAIIQSDAMAFVKGQDAKAPDKLRIFMLLYNEELHVLADKRITSIDDLHRKRVAMSSFGSGTYVTANRVLHETFVGDAKKDFDLSYEDAVKKLLLGEIDAMALVAGKPAPLFKKLEKIAGDSDMGKLLQRLHFVPVTNKKLLEKYCVPSTIGPSDYAWVEAVVPTIAPKAVIALFCDGSSKRKVSEKLKITKLYGIIKSNIGRLKATGHPKWKEVDCNAPPLKGWNVDPSIQYNVNAKKIDALFD